MNDRPELNSDHARRIEARSAHFRLLAQELPGSIPYNNYRPVNVPGEFDGQTIFDVMCRSHPHISVDEWEEIFRKRRISKDGQPVAPDRQVRGGEQFLHLFPETVEPAVDANVEVIWEDEALVVLSKPAPLPMHPSGRFNRNTLTTLLKRVYPDDNLRPAHRLDANTTGIVLFTRTKHAAYKLQSQFNVNENTEVEKEYLVQCDGHPTLDAFECNEPIAKTAGRSGLRVVDPNGKPSRTVFEVLRRNQDQTSLLIARPKTGRTNQIRVHLWSQYLPVVGDPLYLPSKELGHSQTLPIDSAPMCLHADRLSIRHPTSNEQVTFQSVRPNWVSRSQQVD